MKWAYGVTTVPSRRLELLPRTLASLYKAEFPNPRLFIDGADDYRVYRADGLTNEITIRGNPPVRTYGHWILTLWELYLRDPTANRYAIFQDDFVTYRNLRSYLEACPYPDKGYWNLYTFPSNSFPRLRQVGLPCPANDDCVGWYQSNQYGRGAVALVFDRKTVKILLQQPHMINKPEDCHMGYRKVDGAICESLVNNPAIGYKEYVHNPSLVQHTGDYSSMGSKPHKKALSFRGEDFDAMDLLNKESSHGN